MFLSARRFTLVFLAVTTLTSKVGATTNNKGTNNDEHKKSSVVKNERKLSGPLFNEETRQVTSDDGFEHAINGLHASVDVNEGKGKSGGENKLERIIARLDRRPGNASRRQAGRDAFRAASSKVYFDRSYGQDSEGKGLLKGIMAAEVPKNAVQGLKASGLFELIEPDYDVSVMGWMDDDENENEDRDLLRGSHRRLAEEEPWGINFTEANQVPGGGTRIKVCVADTGYYLGHEDLPYCARTDSTCKEKVNGTDAYGEEWNFDGHGHGTHCAGTIGAIGNNNVGVVGVIENQDDWSVEVGKALSRYGSGPTTGVMASVERCVDAGAKVVSMSLGCDSCWQQAGEDFYSELYQNHDVLIIAAAGNSGSTNNVKSYPASYLAAVSVAAIDSSDVRASFSQVNDQVEIAAPGVGVKSTFNGDQAYKTWSGTSMATPHVAGIAAKVWSHFPSCSNFHIRNALGKSAVYPGEDSIYCDWYRGHGNVRAKAMYDLLTDLRCGAGGISKDGDNTAAGNMLGGCNQVYETLAPTTSPAPTESSHPSSVPSVEPTPAPTVSSQPSGTPSISSMPSTAHPTDVPSGSSAPSDPPTSYPTNAPTDEARNVVTSFPTKSIQIQNGAMFDIKAKSNITIYNMDISLYTSTPDEVTIWTKASSFWPDCAFEGMWTKIGVATIGGSGQFAGLVRLPRHTFSPIHVPAGQTQAFYVSVAFDSTVNRVSTDNKGSKLFGTWFEDSFMSVHEGVYKSNWGHTVPNSLDPVTTFCFLGSFLYIPDGTAIPTQAPTFSNPPSISSQPSQITSRPTSAPTISMAPTGTVMSLSTREEGSSFQSAYGYFFDIVGKNPDPIRILNFQIYLKVNFCHFKIYTKAGSNYYGFDQPELWDLIGEGKITQVWPKTKFPFGSFKPQMIEPGETRAFYMAFIDCSSTWPLAVDQGSNYTLGAWAEDENIAIMEGIKKTVPLSWDDPFAVGSNYYCCCAPGNGCAHLMRGGSVFYDVIEKAVTSSPTITATPTTYPSSSPSSGPSSAPSTQPSLPPSYSPSSEPSSFPSEMPSGMPSVSPSESPSPKPSVSPSTNPSSSVPPSTANPTTASSACTLAGIGESCSKGIDCCSGLCSGGPPDTRTCLVNDTSTPSPVAPVPTNSPTTGSPSGPVICTGADNGESCVDGPDCCSGVCSGGKKSDRVCLPN